MGNLRSRTLVAERLWDWEFLNQCFEPTRIRISDVDGEVERNGYFLRLEGKPLGVRLSQAQEIMFKKLIELRRIVDGEPGDRAFTIVVLYGEPSTPERMQVWPAVPTPCTAEDVQTFVRGWFVRSSGDERKPARPAKPTLVTPVSAPQCVHKPEFRVNGRCWICDHG